MNLFTKSLAAAGLACTLSQAAISFTPVNANATDGAKKLYNFLAVNYGAKTISGMMTGEINTSTAKELPDVVSFYEYTGKYPALVGFDFLFANGINASLDWQTNYTQNALAAAKDLWNQGGIPAFTWHWKDPSHTVDAFYTKSGKPTEYTDFDFTQGFTDPSCTANCTWNTSSTTYQQILEDIDEIAAHFLALQEAGVAAIFRPLHEASGAWFWWGTHGGAAFQALYNLVYDEMVNVKGVNNLVWVWNPEYSTDTGWNPGASKYDVISLDIYEAWDYTTKYVSNYKTLSTNFSDKIFAISENGPIPDFSSNYDAGVVWSWWMPWYQSWDPTRLGQTVKSVWKANIEDACVITLEDMPGWSSYTISSTAVEACKPSYKLGDLDTTRPVVEVMPGDTATNAWLRATLSSDTSKGNIIIQSGNKIDLSSASKITLNVFNANSLSGIWFTVAFLGNASTDWGWAQPDGCWVNAGDSTQCTFDLSTTTKDKVVLTGSDYKTFMSNISKVYLEVVGNGFQGKVYFDNVQADSNTINDFENTTQKIEVEQGADFLAEIVGTGKTKIETPAAKLSAVSMQLSGKNLSLTLPKSGATSVSLFDVNGHQVKNLASGSLTAGAHQFDLSAVPQGNYIVRVKGVGFSSVKAVRIR